MPLWKGVAACALARVLPDAAFNVLIARVPSPPAGRCRHGCRPDVSMLRRGTQQQLEMLASASGQHHAVPACGASHRAPSSMSPGRKNTPDDAEQQEEVPPVIGVDDEAFGHSPTKARERGDQIGCQGVRTNAVRRPIEAGSTAAARYRSCRPPSRKRERPADRRCAAAGRTRARIRTGPCRSEIRAPPQRQFLQAEAAALADVVGLDELRALVEHRADRVRRQQDDSSTASATMLTTQSPTMRKRAARASAR